MCSPFFVQTYSTTRPSTQHSLLPLTSYRVTSHSPSELGTLKVRIVQLHLLEYAVHVWVISSQLLRAFISTSTVPVPVASNTVSTSTGVLPFSNKSHSHFHSHKRNLKFHILNFPLKMKLGLLLVTALLSAFVHSVQAVIGSSGLYQCPANGTNPVEIPVGTNVGGSTNVTIAMSPSNCLCLLVRISSLTGNLSSLNMQDWNMAPVARSYYNYSWENVAGPYVDKLKITCAATNCTLNIPHLTNVPSPSHYVLLATNRQVSTKEKVARFLEQVTFGPTLDDVNKFNISSSLSNQFVQWMKQQMDTSITTPTYHREFFRARVDNFMYQGGASRTTRARNPCQVNSRWRKHSFFTVDYGTNFVVSQYNATSFLVTVDGIPRTIIKTFRNRDTLANLTLGTYSFSWYTEEFLGGNVQIYDGNNNWYWLHGGNPPLYLPQTIINQYNTTIKTLQLPDRQYFQDVIPVSYAAQGMQYHYGAGIISTVNFTDTKCQTIAGGLNLIGVFPNNDQWYYDARVLLDQNTVDQPLSDGGGMTGVLCSNVAKNFLNLNQCTLSSSPSACMPFSAPNFPVFLNETSLRMIYQGSGRYVYIIRQLRAEVAYVASPCTPNRRHRWMIVNATSCPTTAGVSTETVNALTAMMNDIGTWDRNSVFSDVHFEWAGWYTGSYEGYTCDATNTNTVGMMFAVNNSGVVTCFRHVHPDEGSVYDFTYWTRPDTHPGNAVALSAGHLPPITKWADYNNTFTLPFPSWHTMDRWQNNKDKFDYVGRSFDNVNFMDLPSMLRSQAVANLFSPTSNVSQAVVVCGSNGEISNNPNTTNVFSFAHRASIKDSSHLSLQKSNVWNMISLSAKDQLRQRMAWALSQILVVTPNQINEDGLSEAYLNYYDIFVRNAFGNYRDVLKEVSQSPMMAEMLSFLESKSSAYVFRTTGLTAGPDQNFAREIMQLFSIGIYSLNIDGTVKTSPDTGLPIPTYRNTDIQNFARAWTGFLQQSQRGNIETWDWDPNRIDPLAIEPRWRDVFPKMNLYGGYIGDTYPLCSDLPQRQFLNIGARYILLGSSSVPEYQTGEDWWTATWWTPYNTIVNLSLNKTSSALYNVLCNVGSDGKCRFKPVVTLNQTLLCQGKECLVDEPRTIRVSDNPPVYYEYIRPACVELSFYGNGRIVRDYSDSLPGICANPAVDKAYEACCTGCGSWGCGGSMFCQFTGEMVRLSTAQSRCSSNNKFSNGALCNWTWIDDYYSNKGCAVWTPTNEYWHWTNQNCTIQAKVDNLGKVSIVHMPQSPGSVMFQDYNLTNTNFFPVTWQGGSFPSPANNCSGVCVLQSGSCLCNIAVVDSVVFTSRPSVNDVITTLSIGGVPPSWFGSSYVLTESINGVDVYQPNGTSTYSVNTLFGVTVYGQMKFFKNMMSMISIGSGTSTFTARNPPHFMNFLIPDTRDVMYETDAVIDHYFYHPNVAPFISRRIIQRFGISNPSPRYISQVANAFTTGTYISQGTTFGDGKYGNLGAMIAAIMLDREARSSVLDADPTFGSMREPMIKLVAFLRAMQFQLRADVKELSLFELTNSIGQMPHETPNVFSFFLPDYTPLGSIKDASLVGPEAQVQTTPTHVGFLNGIISLVDLGLTECYGGFGALTVWWCPWYQDQVNWNSSTYSEGLLGYRPSNSSDAQAIVDELALLLTAGRLSVTSRKTVYDAIVSSTDRKTGIKTAQKLIAASSAYHATGLEQPLQTDKPNMTAPTASGNPYKAVIFVNLGGGMDSYNILMPRSQCSGAGGKDLYQDYKTVRGELALDNNTILPINATLSSQPCKMLGVHPSFAVAQQLYNDKDLIFLANVGVLQEYVNNTNWWQKTTKTQLFAHNVQSDDTAFVDIFRQTAGFGVCGRMADTMGRLGYKAGSSSVSGVATALASKVTPLFVVDPYEIQKVNPIPWATDVVGPIKKVNKREKVGSSIYGKTWSDQLFRALGENQLLYDAFANTNLNATFSNTDLSFQFQAVSKLIKSKLVRGVDRDVFYVQTGGFDTHSNMISVLNDRVVDINDALGSFVVEMKAQGRWNDVVIVFTSEFARTLIPNTSSGSDHAWGGNYFVAGGNLTGGKVLGKFITDFTENNPFILNPGIVIPTTSWDQVWEPIAKWYGVTNDSDLDSVIPSRKNFAGPLVGMFA